MLPLALRPLSALSPQCASHCVRACGRRSAAHSERGRAGGAYEHRWNTNERDAAAEKHRWATSSGFEAGRQRGNSSCACGMGGVGSSATEHIVERPAHPLVALSSGVATRKAVVARLRVLAIRRARCARPRFAPDCAPEPRRCGRRCGRGVRQESRGERQTRQRAEKEERSNRCAVH